jgi:multidrug efflux system membrane fusion protein
MQMHRFPCRLLAVLMPVALACSTAAVAQAPPSAPPAVTVAKPIVKEVVERDDYVGRFEAVDAVEIRARVSGYLQAVSFRDGTIVKTGDQLFTIDKRPYQAALDQAEAAVTSAQSRVAFAQSDYERAAALGRTGNITEQLLEQRRNTLETARGDDGAPQSRRHRHPCADGRQDRAQADLGRQPRHRRPDASHHDRRD